MPKKKIDDKKETVTVDTNAITKEVMAYVDSELDKRLEKVVDDSIRKNVIEEIDKANKRVIRMKNRKIFVKNIFLILFFCIIVVLLYLLYSTGYFDRSPREIKSSNTQNVVQKEDTPEPTLDELKEKYASYIEPYVLSEKSVYLENFYEGNLTKELKNYYSLVQMDFAKLPVEDDYHVIEASYIKDICSSLFDDSCENSSFDYNGNKVRYFEKLKSYVTNGILERDESIIQREIIDIQVEKKVVRITTIEGIIADGGIYSVYPYEYIDEYYDEGLGNYSDSLNKVVYTFNNKKLVSIEKG